MNREVSPRRFLTLGRGCWAREGLEHWAREGLEHWAREGLDRLEQQILRAGREQFRANALAETNQAQVKAMLDALCALDEERNHELEQAREALQNARTEGWVDLLTHLLPAMDSLDEVLAAGSRQMAGWLEPSEPVVVALGTRLKLAGRLLMGTWVPWEQAVPPRERARPEALADWLRGLALVRERLLDQLAGQAIRPMTTVGTPFDPHLHLANQVVRADGANPPGTVVRQLRAGYLRADTVLRYAEVVVAK